MPKLLSCNQNIKEDIATALEVFLCFETKWNETTLTDPPRKHPRNARVISAEELGTMSKNKLWEITLVRGPKWEIHSLTLIISCQKYILLHVLAGLFLYLLKTLLESSKASNECLEECTTFSNFRCDSIGLDWNYIWIYKGVELKLNWSSLNSLATLTIVLMNVCEKLYKGSGVFPATGGELLTQNDGSVLLS